MSNLLTHELPPTLYELEYSAWCHEAKHVPVQPHPSTTLAVLYDPDLMPPDLRRTHQALGRAVGQLYGCDRFTFERERMEHLFIAMRRCVHPKR